MKKYSKILIITLIQAIIYVFTWYIGAIFIDNFQWNSQTSVELLKTFAYTYLITLILNIVVVLCFKRYKHSLRYFLLPLIFITALMIFFITPHFYGVYYTYIFTTIYIIIANCGFVFLSSKKLSDYISISFAILLSIPFSLLFFILGATSILETVEAILKSEINDILIIIISYFVFLAMGTSVFNKVRRIRIYIAVLTILTVITVGCFTYQEPMLFARVSLWSVGIIWAQYLIMATIRFIIDKLENIIARRKLNRSNG